MSAEEDLEVRAIQQVIAALSPLDEVARERVLEYVDRRLGLRRLPLPSIAPAPEELRSAGSARGGPGTDIRSLKREKDPKSANEMAALVAYYVAELAPDDERKKTINSKDIERYFKQAPYPLPKNMRMTLPHAADAGYFDVMSRGEYKLNAVGYNLVAHGMPSAKKQE